MIRHERQQAGGHNEGNDQKRRNNNPFHVHHIGHLQQILRKYSTLLAFKTISH